MKQVEEYMTEVEIDWNLIERKSEGEIKTKVDEWETRRWRECVEGKSSLLHYRM